MQIALDYDGTYTADPTGWSQFIHLMQARGHTVHIVTYRDDRHDVDDALAELEMNGLAKVFYTRGVAKGFWCKHFGPAIDVWIDDRPESILSNSPLSPTDLLGWRAGSRKVEVA